MRRPRVQSRVTAVRPAIAAASAECEGAATADAGAPVGRRALARGLILAACGLWSYWSTVRELVEIWTRSADDSAGLAVPLIALGVIWHRRRALLALPARGSWSGALLILAAEGLRQTGLYYGVGSAERYALVGTVWGLVLLVAGWRVCWELRWVLMFLTLMVPLPQRVHEAIALPLQGLATASAAFVLQMLGFFVTREGNVLLVEGETTIAVAEACSGLRMLTAFVVVAALLDFIVRRPGWQKAALMVCVLPIAVICNAVRGVATALFAHYARHPTLTESFHDVAGLAMMPLALLLSIALFKYLELFAARGEANRRRGRGVRGACPSGSGAEPRAACER